MDLLNQIQFKTKATIYHALQYNLWPAALLFQRYFLTKQKGRMIKSGQEKQ